MLRGLRQLLRRTARQAIRQGPLGLRSFIGPTEEVHAGGEKPVMSPFLGAFFRGSLPGCEVMVPNAET